MISRAIPPPRFKLDNLAALEGYVNILVLEEAALGVRCRSGTHAAQAAVRIEKYEFRTRRLSV